ncbi:hypothetical protein BXO91_27030 (plasmid) [Rhodococcus qingshengii]|nr:hypothetical protein BXO91_27030 [Rhodococcus qingshengii]
MSLPLVQTYGTLYASQTGVRDRISEDLVPLPSSKDDMNFRRSTGSTHQDLVGGLHSDMRWL